MAAQAVSLELFSAFGCCPVFLGKELKEEYYKGFCKQQLWPLFHYLIPLSPTSAERFDPVLWQAYVKANKVRTLAPGALRFSCHQHCVQ